GAFGAGLPASAGAARTGGVDRKRARRRSQRLSVHLHPGPAATRQLRPRTKAQTRVPGAGARLKRRALFFSKYDFAAADHLVVQPETILVRTWLNDQMIGDRKSTRLNSSHQIISYAVFCLKKKKQILKQHETSY